MEYLAAMETYVMLLFVCNVHSIDPVNVCTNSEINRYNIYEVRKHAKIVCLCHVAQKRYVVRHAGVAGQNVSGQ